MPKQFTTTPFEERKSQNLNAVDFIKHIAWGLLPFAGLVAGVVIGKATKNQVMPFNGTPSLISQLAVLGARVGSKRVSGVEAPKLKAIDYMPYARPFSDTAAGQEEVAKTMLNGLKGLEFGAIPSTYFFWRKREAARVDLVDNYADMENLKKLEGLKPTNAELSLEKRSLEQQLDHERKKAGLGLVANMPTTQVRSISDHGHVATSPGMREK